MTILEKIEEMKRRMTRGFPELTYIGKHYSVQDLLRDLDDLIYMAEDGRRYKLGVLNENS